MSLNCIQYKILTFIFTLQATIDSQKAVTKMLGKVRNLTRHLHQSTSDAAIFRSLQNTASPLTLTMDVVTRFDSTYLMAERCLRLEDTVRLYLSKNPLKGKKINSPALSLRLFL